MPTYEIRGQRIEADSPQEALDRYNAEMAGVREVDPRRAKYEAESWYQKLGRGAVNPLIEAYLGGKQALVGLDESEKGALEELRAATEAGGGWGTVGEMATFMLPGGAVAKGVTKGLQAAGRALPMATRAVPTIAAQAAGQGALEGAYQGSRATLEGDPSRLERATTGAVTGAAGGLVGEVAPRVLRRAVQAYGRPAMMKPAAARLEREMVREGLDPNLTVGQAADPRTLTGQLLGGIEETTSRIPGADQLLKGRGEAVGTWNVLEMKKALPKDLRGQVTMAGPEGMTQMHRAIGKAYDEALDPIRGNPLQLTDNAIDALAEVEGNLLPRVPAEAQSRLRTELSNLVDDLSEGRIDADSLKGFETDLREGARAAYMAGDRPVGRVYEAMLESLRQARDEALGAKNAARIRELDRAFGRVADVRDAGGYMGAVREGFFTPSQLQGSGQRGASKWEKAEGKAYGTQRAREAEKVFGETIPRVGPGTAEKLAAQALLGGAIGTGVGLASGQDIGTALTGSGLQYGLGGLAAGAVLPLARRAAFGKAPTQRGARRLARAMEAARLQAQPYLTAGSAQLFDEDQ